MSYFPTYPRVSVLRETAVMYSTSAMPQQIVIQQVSQQKEGCSLCGSLEHDTAECGWRDDCLPKGDS